MNRRRFAALSALTLAATRLPAQKPAISITGAPTLSKPVGFAPVGLGDISEIFMRACAQTPNATITGLVTGHPQEKGAKYAAQYNVPQSSIYTYETYDKIRDNPAIEAVYIGLPNSMHCEYTIRAAEAGKHVLCEKPMAISSAECRKMIDACKRANVHLMIAYRVQYDVTFKQIRDMVRSGQLGEIQTVLGGFYGQKKAGEWRLNRALAGGGSLLDLGIYPLNAARWIVGEEPTDFRAFVSTREKGPRFAQVEQTVQWVMKFPSGILFNGGSSYGEQGPAFLQIDGSAGQIHIEPAFYYGDVKYTFTGNTTHGKVSGSNPVTGQYDQFTAEADHFAACLRNNTKPATPGEEGLADMLAMEAIYRAAGAPIA
ncbi:MAG TPA: Gfo/Idh/MocA family oxidoreductase [Acidobacteriaceae bacterium]|nr:Gfo/Idh/MocA family oxidoreductase [Acidobacteriaceae bacterium]